MTAITQILKGNKWQTKKKNSKKNKIKNKIKNKKKNKKNQQNPKKAFYSGQSWAL